MSNRTFKPSPELAQKICDEIAGKSNAYESKMSTRLARWVECAELYCGKTSTMRENSKLSPNSAELYKAARAITNMQYRMLTSQKPFFELEPLDVIGYADPNKVLKAEHYVTNNMDLSRFGKGLYRSLLQLNLYGSVAVHQQYEPLRSSFLGKKRYITSYRPVSLINCAFALDAYDIEESGWVCINDIQAKTSLTKCLLADPEEKLYNHKAIKAAINEDGYAPHVNTWVQQRMAWSGYVSVNFDGGIERSTYYGPLDCMDDGEEYAIEMVNRKHVIRMETYDGIRPVRIATTNTLDVEPLGNGLGDQFRPLLAQLDDIRSSLLNTVTLAGANMFKKQKGLSDEDMEFSVRNFGILNLENPASMENLGPAPQTVAELAGYEASLVRQFRQGSGATDTLQALVQGDSSTATEVSLAMNEAVRNISVAAEQIAPMLVGDAVKMILQNGQKYQTTPFTLIINKAPITITPSDLLIDVDVRVKTMTDQDFRPAKINRLMSAATLILNTPPNAMQGVKYDATPVITEILKLLDVPQFNKVAQPITEEDLMRASVMAQMQAPQAPGAQGQPGMPQDAQERAIRNDQLGVTGNRAQDNTVSTPSGDVLSAPGDQVVSNAAIRSATNIPGQQE